MDRKGGRDHSRLSMAAGNLAIARGDASDISAADLGLGAEITPDNGGFQYAMDWSFIGCDRSQLALTQSLVGSGRLFIDSASGSQKWVLLRNKSLVRVEAKCSDCWLASASTNLRSSHKRVPLEEH